MNKALIIAISLEIRNLYNLKLSIILFLIKIFAFFEFLHKSLKLTHFIIIIIFKIIITSNYK